MKYKLIDVVGKVDEDITFGTCELCMSVGNLYYNEFIVEDVDGNRYVFEDGYWSWGDWITIPYQDIHNVIQFAEWLSKQDLPEYLDEYTFWNAVDEYTEEYQEVEEW